MQHLLGFIGSWIPGHPLRPLLIGAGAAVVAAGVFHFERKRRLDEKVKVSKLEDKVRELEDLICETQRECEKKTEDLQATLDEAEDKYEKTMKSKVELEKENSDLISNINLLQDTVQEHTKELHDVYEKCAELTKEYEQEKEEHEMLKSEYTKAKESIEDITSKTSKQLHAVLPSKEMSLKVSECVNKEAVIKAQTTYEQLNDFHAELKKESTDLTSKAELLQDAVEEKREEISETYRKCNFLRNEYEQEKEKHEMLKSEYEDMKKSFENNGNYENNRKDMQDALAEAEKKYEQMMKSNDEIRTKNHDLTSQSNDLQDIVYKLQAQINKSQRMTRKLREDEWKTQEDYNILKSEYEVLLQNCNELQQEIEREQKAQNNLKTVCDRMKEIPESSAGLEQVSELICQVTILQGSVQLLEEEFHDVRGKCDGIMVKREEEKKAHNLMQLKYQEMKEALGNCKILIMRHLRPAPEDRTDP
ncbi:hypothetical protein KOW79_005395 [Hemibagrus wyckioides]|uniref:Uncharacterized protein n=1 Tax=Hemibagrus wyckioides TaxID=337641 RepID=A0A9D3NZK5_9TELE|nr:hypothetical protein KOW79_005395 [Hemibagrus wyckioides]